VAPDATSTIERVLLAEHVAQESTGVGRLNCCDVLGRPLGDDRSPAVTAIGAEVNDPVGGLDDVEVVFAIEWREGALRIDG
jgi:hypothetical protein